MLSPQVQAFIAVVETGSFTAASQRIGTTKARVSQQVSALEQRLGCSLLRRSTRRVTLTEPGEHYYRECARAQTLLGNAEQLLQEESERLSGLIRINSVGGLLAEQCLGPALFAFMQRYPEIEIELDLSSNQVDILNERFDLVLRMGPLADSGLIARPLCTLASYAVASPAYLERYGKPSQPSDLARHRCLSGSVKRWQLQHHTGRQEEVNVTGSLSAANGHMLCQAALAGLGIARLNSLYTDRYVASGDLVSVFDDWQFAPSPVSLLYPRSRYKLKRVQLLVEHLQQHFSSYTN
ncbi:LysR family transcriptional regulator [Aliagarivorans marinus]|uniref:LysR family transcriptional regulator n=1 Tax=Aliagarivorans marinus TaxID=561965 RepID=UPI0003F8097B|nr:LysR family transcriptional regulator [Aliagarivorans marinus]